MHFTYNQSFNQINDLHKQASSLGSIQHPRQRHHIPHCMFRPYQVTIMKNADTSAEHILPTRCTTFRLLHSFFNEFVDFQVHWTINVEMAYA